jgi:hypothetical protein
MNIPPLNMDDPNQACLAVGGDCIVQEAKAAAKALEAKAKGHKHTVIKIIDRAAKKTGIHPHFLWWALFRGPRQWPPLGAEDKRYLMLLREVYEASGAIRPKTLDSIRGGNPSWDIPDDENQIRAAFKIMVKEAQTEVYRPLLKVWAAIVKKAVPLIQRKCREVFQMECDADEAESMLYGDLQRLWVLRRLPVDRPQLIQYLLDL